MKPIYYMPLPNRRRNSETSGLGICLGILLTLFVVSIGIFLFANLDFKTVEDFLKTKSNQLQGKGEIRDAFDRFVEKYEKAYSSSELQERYEIFAENYRKIIKHNEEGHSYSFGINQFSDMTSEEFKKTYLFPKEVQKSKNYKYLDNSKADSTIDWVAMGKVDKVRDQRSCGSCWSFSATGSVSSLQAIQNGLTKPNSFSTQELVDCSRRYGNAACNGGTYEGAFEYIIDHGISTSQGYPYIARKHWWCRKRNPVYKINGYQHVPMNDSDQLLNALMNQPLSVAVDAEVWQYYEDGIIDSNCGVNLDHDVVLVAAGYDSKLKQNYWTIQNSWGPDWGENGYVRVLRQSGTGPGVCGIAMNAGYPTV